MTAQAFGGDKKDFLKSIFWIGMCNALLIGALIIALILMAGQWIITLFAETSLVADLAWTYMRLFCLFILARAMSIPITSYLMGCAQTQPQLKSSIFEIIINATLSYMLIYGVGGFPQMGLAGAAIGSVVGAWFKTAFLSVVMLKNYPFIFKGSSWSERGFLNTYRLILDQVLPIAVTYYSGRIMQNILLLIYAMLGTSAFAALSLVNTWIILLANFSNAWVAATGILVGQALGRACEKDEVQRFVSLSWKSALIVSLCVAAGYFLIMSMIPFIYANLDSETLGYLRSFIPVLLLLPILRTINHFCSSILRAGGDSKYQMKVNTLTQWCFTLPATAICVLIVDLSATWIFALLLVEASIKIPFLHVRMKKGIWMRKLLKNI